MGRCNIMLAPSWFGDQIQVTVINPGCLLDDQWCRGDEATGRGGDEATAVNGPVWERMDGLVRDGALCEVLVPLLVRQMAQPADEGRDGAGIEGSRVRRMVHAAPPGLSVRTIFLRLLLEQLRQPLELRFGDISVL